MKKRIDILCYGAPLVEIMRKRIDQPLDQVFDFIGPFPSGDTAIMIDEASKMGADAALVGVVGKDDFGACILKRLESDGVNISGIRVSPDHCTAVAFVSYQDNGGRKFIFTVPDSAASKLGIEDVSIDDLQRTRWLHISGFPLCLSQSAREAVDFALDHIPEQTQVSFDPNLRFDISKNPELLKLVEKIMHRCNYFLPSETEAAYLTGMQTDEEGCQYLAGQGKIVVQKRGKAGCIVYTPQERITVPSYKTQELDPTGAGDTFCGALLAELCHGSSALEAARIANAAGALAVRKKGPMEGTATREEVLSFMKKSEKEVQ